jgi:hypothetical protein
MQCCAIVTVIKKWAKLLMVLYMHINIIYISYIEVIRIWNVALEKTPVSDN